MKFEPIEAKPRLALGKASSRAAVSPAVVAAAAALIAIAIQSLWLPVDADVSWLITVSERVLAGDRLYLDIFELNPPASVWLYVPFVWLAQLIGAKPEAVVVGGFVAAGLASIAATIRLSSRLRDAPSALFLAAVLGFVTLILPMALFAQREHAALLLALPALAALAVVADDERIGRPAVIASGVAAGLILVIKPYFAFAVMVPAVWSAYRRRSLLPLAPAIAAGAAVVALYAAAVAAFAPAYFDYVPVILETYSPMRDKWWKVAIGPALYPAICAALVLLLRPPRIPSLTVAWGLGAAGFLAAAVIQAKNYPNHWLPQAGLAIAAAFVVLPFARAERGRAMLVAAGLAVVGLSLMNHWIIRPDPAIAVAIERVAPPRPKIIALSPQLTTGHPVTRNVGGEWVGSRAGLFTASGAKYSGMKTTLAQKAYREDIQSFADDVGRTSPDIVLVHVNSKRWLMSEPSVAAAMTQFEKASSAGDTEIWLRRRN